ncbi:hypothetical protein TREMEDRAFT_12051, partial [Tremella mesenterica DSM 1558]|uniref:uncharacterized protein n=1 Tax=Tremella mesenterica (strain ATCC 24925 / CBS 8224 / DSM 1558 / NBRC 9311 / NRRL Y-6157 / RJB 2259-6 / UBC 559-6) TaxID=578456 RepID=UPI0003F48E76
RPGYGTNGRQLSILANFYQVRALGGKGRVIHHYDIEIDPAVPVTNQKKPKSLMRTVWEQLVVEQVCANSDWTPGFKTCAFDGRKNAFTPIEFPIPRDVTHTFTTAITHDAVVQRSRNDSSSDEEMKRWKVKVRHVAIIDLELVMKYCRADEGAPSNEEQVLTGVMAVNVLMRDHPSRTYAQCGASGNRFFTIEQAVAISHGAIVARGFMQSFCYSSSGRPLLNLDIGFSAFLDSGPLLQLLPKLIGRGMGGERGRNPPPGGYYGGVQSTPEITELNEMEIKRLKDTLRGAKFRVTHRHSSRLHTVMSVTLQSAERITFSMQSKDGRGQDQVLSLPQYFRDYYQATITRPRLPCIQYGKKSFIPFEFVELAEWNSVAAMKLTPDQTAEMIRISAVKPRERAAKIQQWRVDLAYEKQEKISAWGLQVNKQMVELKARVLAAPSVKYANVDVRPEGGEWSLRAKKASCCFIPLKAWAFISFDKFLDEDPMRRYIQYLIDVLEAHGVEVENRHPPCIGPINPFNEARRLEALQEAARDAYRAGKRNPQLICVILPGKDAWLYEAIKKSSFVDLKAPVPTQCMQAAKIRTHRGIEAYTENLVMKIQSKLGGITHRIPFNQLPGMVHGRTMLLGADVGHPPIKPGLDNAPSVACSIATTNPDCDAFTPQIRLQRGRGEIICDLADMVVNHLRIFKDRNGEYPERILIFRDGVSEGQYAATLQYEHHAVHQACERLQRGYRARILVCICAKRHNTRFFGSELDIDKTGNLPSGLVVDRSVTHPFVFDFFLQAHSSRAGTARPTHYVCLLDELGMTPDELQQLVYNLCHSFSRCTKSVSLVPVCYIADLVCQKARIIVHERGGSTTAPSESSG